MRSLRWLLVAALVASAGLIARPATGATPSVTDGAETGAVATRPARRVAPSARVVGYVSSWSVYERGFEMADVDADSLTHLNYAFLNVVDGRCALGDRWADVERPRPTDDPSLSFRGNLNQLRVLRDAHPHLRLLLSVGGSTWSGGFSAAAATPTARRRFATSCADLVRRYGFDGLDLDWEFPAASDRDNFTELLVELRRELDRLDGSRRELTIAGPAGAPNLANIDVPAVVEVVDWINVMAYDFAGPWSPATGHLAPLDVHAGIEDPTFTVRSTMERWTAAGAPPQRLVLGLPFYGRGFGGVSAPGPGQHYSGLPSGTTEPGVFDYADLVTRLDGYIVSFDPAAGTPSAYDPVGRVWITYDDERSITAKARFARDGGFGGVMVWELSNDADGALLGAAVRSLRSTR